MRRTRHASAWSSRPTRVVVLVFALLLPSIALGCGVYQAGIRTGPSPSTILPPRDPAEVRLFGGDDPAIASEEIGFVVGIGGVDEEWLALRRLRGAAAKLGADAVVDLRFEVVQSSLLVARGRAVKLAARTPESGGQP